MRQIFAAKPSFRLCCRKIFLFCAHLSQLGLINEVNPPFLLSFIRRSYTIEATLIAYVCL